MRLNDSPRITEVQLNDRRYRPWSVSNVANYCRAKINRSNHHIRLNHVCGMIWFRAEFNS